MLSSESALGPPSLYLPVALHASPSFLPIDRSRGFLIGGRYDTDGSISNLIEMERESPESMLEASDLADVQQGTEDIRCAVCVAASKVAFIRATKRRLLADEEALSEMVQQELCYGTPQNKIDDEYPKYPGNPPLWGEYYTVRKKKGRGGGGRGGGRGAWKMTRLRKGAKLDEKGGMEYTALVVKHSMIARSCKQVVLEHDEYSEDEESTPDLAQTLYEYAASRPSGGGSAHVLAAMYCRPFCGGGGVQVGDGLGDGTQKDEI